MKIHILISVLTLILFSCNSAGNKKGRPPGKPDKNEPEIQLTEFEFNEDFHNFGKLTSGETVIFTFVFRNIGSSDLVIQKATSDCGCIHVKFDPVQVKPGKEGTIEVEFNTVGLYDKQLKTIMVTANIAELHKMLYISADVINDAIKINDGIINKNN